jgi:CopG family nickel-responsive transcriptional regulator
VPGIRSADFEAVNDIHLIVEGIQQLGEFLNIILSVTIRVEYQFLRTICEAGDEGGPVTSIHAVMDDLERMIAERGYQNRSEAIRDFTRAGMQQAAQKLGKSGNCVAALVYLYDHAARDLSRRLVENYHGHHDLSVATLHVHLDDDNCMEVTALKGTGAEVQHFADHIIAERGVRYGRLVMIPTETEKKAGSARKGTRHRHP